MPATDDLGRTILAANYDGIPFPVTQASASEGHDNAKHVSRLRRGADIEPTGLKAVSGSLTASFVNGLEEYVDDLYPRVYRELVEKMRTTPIGRLTHPFLGQFTALCEAWDHQFEGDRRNGCDLTIKWTEHNGEAGVVRDDNGSTLFDSPAATTSRASTADVEMAAADPSASYRPTAPTIATELAFLDGANRRYSEIVLSVGRIIDVVTGNLVLSVFAGVSGHAAIVALERLRASVLGLRSRYLARFERIAVFVVPRPMSIYEASVAVYGGAASVDLIRSMNQIVDELVIPAGRELRIVPAA